MGADGEKLNPLQIIMKATVENIRPRMCLLVSLLLVSSLSPPLTLSVAPIRNSELLSTSDFPADSEMLGQRSLTTTCSLLHHFMATEDDRWRVCGVTSVWCNMSRYSINYYYLLPFTYFHRYIRCDMSAQPEKDELDETLPFSCMYPIH